MSAERESLFASLMAQQYADDPAFKAELDHIMGVFHLPPHKPGTCDGCDAARAKGKINDAEWERFA